MKLLVLSFLFVVGISEARVFSMQNAKFSGYVSGSYGASMIKKEFFEGESSATAFNKGFDTNLGGDFGFVYSTGYVGWIFGFDFIKPAKITGGVATTGGVQKYNYTSDVSVFAPKVGLELVLHMSQDFRLSLIGAVGTASLTTKTDYTSLSIAPNADFTLEGKGSAALTMGGMSAEWHLNDNTTFVIQASYRDLKFDKIKYSEAAAMSFQGAQPVGATMTKLDGSNRKLNFTGYYTQIGLRFWLF